jgi:hypothetical protein
MPTYLLRIAQEDGAQWAARLRTPVPTGFKPLPGHWCPNRKYPVANYDNLGTWCPEVLSVKMPAKWHLLDPQKGNLQAGGHRFDPGWLH